MSPIVVSLICGVGFGAVAVALMLPMTFPNKRAALMAAIVTRAYVPILVIGAVGGAIIGYIARA